MTPTFLPSKHDTGVISRNYETDNSNSITPSNELKNGIYIPSNQIKAKFQSKNKKTYQVGQVCPDEKPFGYGIEDKSEISFSIDLKKQNRKLI